MIAKGTARRAFDLSDEKPETLERYRRAGNKYMYSHSPSPVTWQWESFVRARRLVEAGVPFVSMQVGLWDHHCAKGCRHFLSRTARSCLTTTTVSRPSSPTCTSEGCMTMCVSSCGGNSVARLGSTNRVAATIGQCRQRAVLWWRAEDGAIRGGYQFTWGAPDHPGLHSAEHPGHDLPRPGDRSR